MLSLIGSFPIISSGPTGENPKFLTGKPTLRQTDIAMGNPPFEDVSPSKNGGFFHYYAGLPKGNFLFLPYFSPKTDKVLTALIALGSVAQAKVSLVVGHTAGHRIEPRLRRKLL